MQLVGLVFALALVGCGNSAPSCKDALDKAAKTLGEDVSGQLEQMTAECERSGWTAEQRSCLANANDKLTLAACAIISRARKARDESLAVKKAMQAEQEARVQAQEALDRARNELDQLAKDLAAFDGRLEAATAEVIHARNDAELAAAKARLEALKQEKVELDARVVAAKAAADKANRVNGVQP